METFEQVWESARTNAWSWAYPATLCAGVALLIALSLIRSGWIRRTAKIIVIIGLTVIATESSHREIQEK